MRTRLLATMVDALRRNVARGTRDVGVFELGLVVALDGPQGVRAHRGRRHPAVRRDARRHPGCRAAAAASRRPPPRGRPRAGRLVGRRATRPTSPTSSSWRAPLGEALGVALEVTADAVAPFHPGRCARVTLADGTLVGHVGELHPKVVAALGLPAAHRRRRARPRRADGGIRGDRAGPHARHVPDGAERRRRRRRRGRARRRRAARAARRRGGAPRVARRCSTSTAATRSGTGASRSPTGSPSGRPTAR